MTTMGALLSFRCPWGLEVDVHKQLGPGSGVQVRSGGWSS